ncbi:hypothetical protein [Brevibacillus brevis]|uniref:hypothetical protein n=1 Tax=Brevibacillus brevis TaxID=1393 RepID=UPI000D0E8BC5|nr:hypothetical protein [Brevibacillus brevis]PSJ67436.1 hypothetical protein C7J99_20815 [Brevibacillus brevis]RED28418.1 hypothetical protein DES34_108285 [Brevibacillus brevis]GEC90672.1 hypothetical protein BBR01nite_30030 [Brevibacillus brevis]VEF91113.1 Uncharacterised protein [Brevibacillus brevis]
MDHLSVDKIVEEEPKQSKKMIEIDCPPGPTRPDYYLKLILKDTGIPFKDTNHRVFGEWTWCYDEIDDETWMNAFPVICERQKELYEEGFIRYASVSNPSKQ